MPKRQANGHGNIIGMLNDFEQRRHGLVDGVLSIKCVLAAIARNAQFGQTQQANCLTLSFGNGVDDILGIVFPR